MFDSGAPRSVLTVAGARRAGVNIDGPDVIQIGGGSGIGARVVTELDRAVPELRDRRRAGEGHPHRASPTSSCTTRTCCSATTSSCRTESTSPAPRARSTSPTTAGRCSTSSIRRSRSRNRPLPSAPPGASPAPGPWSAEAPKDAASFARRAAAEMAREAYDAAIADDSQAIALDPADAAHFFDRGLARLADHQPVLAMADLDQALKLKPDYAAALVGARAAEDDGQGRRRREGGFRRGPARRSERRRSDRPDLPRAGKFADADRVGERLHRLPPAQRGPGAGAGVRCRARAFSGDGLDRR